MYYMTCLINAIILTNIILGTGFMPAKKKYIKFIYMGIIAFIWLLVAVGKYYYRLIFMRVALFIIITYETVYCSDIPGDKTKEDIGLLVAF